MSVKLDLFALKERLVCSSCLAQYEMTTAQKWLVSFGSAFFVSFSFLAGILAQSWLVFFFVAFVLPFALHVAVEKYGKLKLVGIKRYSRYSGSV